MSTETHDETPEAEPSPEVELLREENRRLREAYRRTKRVQYRRTALGLGGVGVLALAAAVLFPSVQDTLLVLGAIGVFGGLVTVYLTPDRVLTAAVSDAVYGAHADTGAAIVEELGLQADHLYVPTDDGASGVRVFRPLHAEYSVPEDPTSLFVVDADEDARGAAVPATGERLYREFEAAAVVGTEATASETIPAVADAVVEQFELAESVEYDHDDGRVTVTVAGAEPADVGRFDHPVVSLFGVALARTTGGPVELAAVAPDEDRVTLTWRRD